MFTETRRSELMEMSFHELRGSIFEHRSEIVGMDADMNSIIRNVEFSQDHSSAKACVKQKHADVLDKLKDEDSKINTRIKASGHFVDHDDVMHALAYGTHKKKSSDFLQLNPKPEELVEHFPMRDIANMSSLDGLRNKIVMYDSFLKLFDYMESHKALRLTFGSKVKHRDHCSFVVHHNCKSRVR